MRRSALLLTLCLLLSTTGVGQQEDWLKRQAEAAQQFEVAARGIDAPATLAVLKSIYTVPPQDGRVLYDLIIEKRYRRILDIGTGRGASALWMALAAVQTEGKVVTIEWSPVIAQSARENFARSEVADAIELRTGDARRELSRLEGAFDLIFVDIGSEDAMALFDRIYPKLAPLGAIVVHDVLKNGEETPYAEFVRRHPGLDTTVRKDSGPGLAVSVRKPSVSRRSP